MEIQTGAEMTTPLNGIKANWFHDEGAIAQCGRCRRYTLDHSALSDRQLTCTCGEKHYWSGSFKKPGPDAQWHGAAPTVFDDLAVRLETVIDATQATLNAERLVRCCPGCGSIGPVESALAAQAHEAAPNEWQGIHTLPDSDDLVWLYCQDTNTIEGPVTPRPHYADSWTHWAPAEAPSTAAIDAACLADRPEA